MLLIRMISLIVARDLLRQTSAIICREQLKNGRLQSLNSSSPSPSIQGKRFNEVLTTAILMARGSMYSANVHT